METMEKGNKVKCGKQGGVVKAGEDDDTNREFRLLQVPAAIVRRLYNLHARQLQASE